MIFNAKDKSLDQISGLLPNVGSALLSWFQQLSFNVVTKTVVDFQTVETESVVFGMGVRQPMGATRIQMKPEGQREWKWHSIYTLPDLVLKIDDRISYQGLKYRVAAQTNYIEYGYIEYEVVEDYQ